MAHSSRSGAHPIDGHFHAARLQTGNVLSGISHFLVDNAQSGWLPMWKNIVETNIMVKLVQDRNIRTVQALHILIVMLVPLSSS